MQGSALRSNGRHDWVRPEGVAAGRCPQRYVARYCLLVPSLIPSDICIPSFTHLPVVESASRRQWVFEGETEPGLSDGMHGCRAHIPSLLQAKAGPRTKAARSFFSCWVPLEVPSGG